MASEIAFSKGRSARATAQETLSLYVDNHRVPIIAAAAVLVLGVIGYVVFSIFSSKMCVKALNEIDAISRQLTAESSTLDDASLEARRVAAMKSLEPLTNKSGVAGVRANMLAAEVAWQRGEYGQAAAYWQAASSKGKNAYTAPLALFNEAAAMEETGDNEKAAELYGKAAECDGFLLRNAASFNQGRVYESMGETDKARDVYYNLASAIPTDSWANLAKSRLLALGERE